MRIFSLAIGALETLVSGVCTVFRCVAEAGTESTLFDRPDFGMVTRGGGDVIVALCVYLAACKDAQLISVPFRYSISASFGVPI